MRLGVGDSVYRDPQRENFGRCNRCKRHKMVIVEAPPGPTPEQPKGFWKVPTE